MVIWHQFIAVPFLCQRIAQRNLANHVHLAVLASFCPVCRRCTGVLIVRFRLNRKSGAKILFYRRCSLQYVINYCWGPALRDNTFDPPSGLCCKNLYSKKWSGATSHTCSVRIERLDRWGLLSFFQKAWPNNCSSLEAVRFQTVLCFWSSLKTSLEQRGPQNIPALSIICKFWCSQRNGACFLKSSHFMVWWAAGTFVTIDPNFVAGTHATNICIEVLCRLAPERILIKIRKQRWHVRR